MQRGAGGIAAIEGEESFDRGEEFLALSRGELAEKGAVVFIGFSRKVWDDLATCWRERNSHRPAIGGFLPTLYEAPGDQPLDHARERSLVDSDLRDDLLERQGIMVEKHPQYDPLRNGDFMLSQPRRKTLAHVI